MNQKIKQNKCAVADTKFRAYWKNKEYAKAISVYDAAERPFWLTQDVARYYERREQFNKAMQEYEYMMDEYKRIKIISLPRGPVELFKLGKWNIDKDKVKAREYLKLYLSAEDECGGDPAFYLRHKNSAEKMLNRLSVR